MPDLDRIMDRKTNDPALIVWNGDILITVQPDEFPKMKAIIEKEGEHNFADDSNDSFTFQLNLYRQGEDEPFELDLTVPQFELHLRRLCEDLEAEEFLADHKTAEDDPE